MDSELGDSNGFVPANKLSGSDCIIDGYDINIQGDVVKQNSVQGFDLTNLNSVYVASGSTGHKSKIGKIMSKYDYFDVELKNGHWTGNLVETESVQIKGGQLYVTMSYHKNDKYKTTSANRIYKVQKTLINKHNAE